MHTHIGTFEKCVLFKAEASGSDQGVGSGRWAVLGGLWVVLGGRDGWMLLSWGLSAFKVSSSVLPADRFHFASFT